MKHTTLNLDGNSRYRQRNEIMLQNATGPIGKGLVIFINQLHVYSIQTILL